MIELPLPTVSLLLEHLQPRLLNLALHTSVDVPGQCPDTSVLSLYLCMHATMSPASFSNCPAKCMYVVSAPDKIKLHALTNIIKQCIRAWVCVATVDFASS